MSTSTRTLKNLYSSQAIVTTDFCDFRLGILPISILKNLRFSCYFSAKFFFFFKRQFINSWPTKTFMSRLSCGLTLKKVYNNIVVVVFRNCRTMWGHFRPNRNCLTKTKNTSEHVVASFLFLSSFPPASLYGFTSGFTPYQIIKCWLFIFCRNVDRTGLVDH